jgi:hypothetical protein
MDLVLKEKVILCLELVDKDHQVLEVHLLGLGDLLLLGISLLGVLGVVGVHVGVRDLCLDSGVSSFGGYLVDEGNALGWGSSGGSSNSPVDLEFVFGIRVRVWGVMIVQVSNRSSGESRVRRGLSLKEKVSGLVSVSGLWQWQWLVESCGCIGICSMVSL